MAEDNSIFDKIMEIGMGMTIANQIPRMMNSVMPSQPIVQSPPRIDPNALQIFASINGSQAGPFNEHELITLIQKGLINKDTLIWKLGMSNWLQANQVPDVGKLLLLYSNI